MRRLDDVRMAGQSEVIIRAEIDYLLALRRVYRGGLRRRNDALGFP